MTVLCKIMIIILLLLLNLNLERNYRIDQIGADMTSNNAKFNSWDDVKHLMPNGISFEKNNVFDIKKIWGKFSRKI